jgi:hypothetical protein
MEFVMNQTPTLAPPKTSNESSFSRTYDADEHLLHFTVQPAKVGYRTIAFFVPAVLVGMVAMPLAGRATPEVFLIGAAIGFFVCRWLHINSIESKRAPGDDFKVNAGGVIWDTYRVARADISGLTVRRGIVDKANQSLAGGRNVDRYGPYSWQLHLDYSGRSAVLAGGMTEATANALQNEVTRILEDREPSTGSTGLRAGSIRLSP